MILELRKLGLTEYEAKVYEVLLKLKSSTGGEISKQSKVPHGKTYESLHNLADMGLITILPMEPKVFRAISPKEGLKRLIEQKESILEEAKKNIIESITDVGAKKDEVHEKLEIYSGVKRQFEIAGHFVETTKSQLLIISKGEKVPNMFMIKAKKLVKTQKDVRFVVHQFNGNRKFIKKFLDIGLDTRYFPTGEFTLAVKDKKECLFVIKNPKNVEDRIVIFFRDSAISRAMAEYFESTWRKAKPIKL